MPATYEFICNLSDIDQKACGRRVEVAARLELVRRIPYFASLPEPEVERLARAARFITLGAGETLFHEGEPAEGLYVLVKGRVRIVRYSPQGRQLIVRQFTAGESFNEVGALDASENPATAIVEEDGSELLLVPGDIVQQLVAAYPTLGQAMSQEMARKLRFAMEKMNTLALMDVKSRLAEHLLHAADERGVIEGVSHEELAAEIGTVRQVLTRALGQLQRQGAVEVKREFIRILDASLLHGHE